MPFTHYRTKAIFLKKEARGEADEIFTLFTKDFGKIKVIGRAIRKITSKLRAGADVFCYSEIEFIQGKQYKTLTDAVLIGKFVPDYKIADAIDGLVPKAQRDDKIWSLFSSKSSKLNFDEFGPSLTSTKICRNLTTTYTEYFLWKLFDILGYCPELYNCACCGKKLLPETLFFAPSHGGAVCPPCFQRKNNENDLSCKISVDTVKILRIFLKEPMDIIEKLKLHSQNQQNIDKVTEIYLKHLKQICR